MTTQTTTARTINAAALDNLLRRELNISDPRDPQQVAQALLRRYSGDPRVRSLEGEAKGLPSTVEAAAAAVLASQSQGPLAAPATSRDLAVAKKDLEQDFTSLLTSPLTKDFRPELEAWQAAVDTLMQQGLTAAARAADLLNRDRMFASRRRLSEYARLARLVGTLTPELRPQYRSLAFSIDEVRAVMFVQAGEALSGSDPSGDGFIVKVSRPELEVRREAILMALRNLTGAPDDALDVATRPIGLVAYSEMLTGLDEQGDGDLRALANDEDMASLLEGLLSTANSDTGQPDGARRLGATKWGPLQTLARFSRVVRSHFLSLPSSGGAVTLPEPIEALLEAVDLFLIAFGAAGGSRLMHAARPLILAGTINASIQDVVGTGRLLEMIRLRGNLQRRADEFAASSPSNLEHQIHLDMGMHFADCALDLHAAGADTYGIAEARAVGFAVLIDGVLVKNGWRQTGNAPNPNGLELDRYISIMLSSTPVSRSSGSQTTYGYPTSGLQRPNRAEVQQDIRNIVDSDARLRTTVRVMASLDAESESVFANVLTLDLSRTGANRSAYDVAHAIA